MGPSIFLTIAASIGVAGPAAACERVNFGVGVAHIAPRSSSSPLVITEMGGVATHMPLEGTGVRARNASTLLLLGECQTSERFKVRLSFGWPPTHHLEGTGTLAPVGEIGKFQQLSPTLLAIYSFAPSPRVRPFAGLGINYTWFKRVHLTNDAFRQNFFGPESTASADVSPSWNPVAAAGAQFSWGSAFSIEAAVSYLPLKAKATVSADRTAQGVPVKVTSELKSRSVITSLTLNYSWGR